MSSELSKTISTCAVWLAMACILTFGFFKMDISGEAAVLILVFVPLAMVGGAVGATAIIWQSPREDKNKRPSDASATLNPTPPAPPTFQS